MRKIDEIYLGKFKLSEMMYLISVSIYLTFLMLDTTTFNPYIYYKIPIIIIAIMSCIVFLKMILFDNFTKRELILSIIFFVSCTLVFLKSRLYYMVFLSVFIIGSKNIDFKKICKVYLIIGIVITIIAALGVQFNIIEHVIRYRDDVPRYSFGSIYATDFASRIFFLCAAYCYLNYENLKIRDSIIFWIAGIFVSYYCDARLDTISIFILSVFPIAKNILNGRFYINHINKYFKWLISLSIPIFATLSIGVSYMYNPNNKFMLFLNKILSSRLSLGKTGLDKYGITLLGEDIKMTGLGGSNKVVTEYFFIDSSYLQIALKYGIIFLVVVCIYYVLFMKNRLENDDILLPTLIVIVGIHGIIAHHFINPAYNVFLLALFANINKIKENEKNISIF